MNNIISKIRLSGDNLKIIAAIVMFIDHASFCILHYYMSICYMDITPEAYTRLNNLYEVGRGIGRTAFPIFCFLLVEGFIRTSNVRKHAIRLFVFALISEVPFDLAHFRVPFDWSHQNVMLELFLGFMLLILIKYIQEELTGLSEGLRWLCICCSVVAACEIATLTKLDYNLFGILLISVLYLLRDCNPLNYIGGAAVISREKYAPIAFVLLYFYDSTKKPKLKYFFYLFYPAHLLLIYLIAFLLFR